MKDITTIALGLLDQNKNIISFLESQQVDAREFSMYVAKKYPNRYAQVLENIQPLIQNEHQEFQLPKIDDQTLDKIKKDPTANISKWPPFDSLEEDSTANTDLVNLSTRYSAFVIPKDQVDDKLFELILLHILQVWASDNKEHFKYIISWLSHLVKFPFKKLPMITLIGSPNSGKTCLITNFLFKYVFNDNNCIQVNSLDDILRNYNTHLTRNKLIYVTEIQNIDTTNKMNTLNYFINDILFFLQKKSINIIATSNCSHFFEFFNNENRQLLKPNKRHIVFKTSNIHQENKCYFNKLHTCFTPEVGSHFYSWLYHLADLPNLNIEN